MSELKLSAYEQSAVAELCSVMKSAHWQLFGIKQPLVSEKIADDVYDVLLKFENVKWDVLYDKFHRTGANA